MSDISRSPGTGGKRSAPETKFQYARIATPEKPFGFRSGAVLDDLSVGYETYGQLNPRRDNAILVFHALSGSQHAAGFNSEGPEGMQKRFWTDECHVGWWDAFIGPGRALDTRRFFVICANFLGGCYGTTGPASIDPKTGKPYGASFPNPTISDIVDSQMRLLDHLQIAHLVAVVGGSLGGCCAINLALRYPDRVHTVIPIASGLRATVLTKALNFEQIYAVEEDRNFNRGNYYDGPFPDSGLTLARMISHKTFVSLNLIESRARQSIVQPDDVLSGYKLQNQVESYMLHQGRKFVKRFDPNSYLRILNAWQSFDLPRELEQTDSSKLFRACRAQDWLLFTISSDVCFFPEEQVEMAEGLKKNRASYTHITVNSDKGHDSFLLEPDHYKPYISYKLGESYEKLTGNFDI